MRLLRGRVSGQAPSSHVIATIGNFDGVHHGHQALIRTLVEQARSQQLKTLVLLFEPQPHEYFHQDVSHPRLSGFKEKYVLLKALGVDYVCCLRFDKALASMTADDFAHDILFQWLRVKHLYIGHDFCFGRGREGTPQKLQTIASHYDATVTVFDDVMDAGIRVSSTEVRSLLSQGQLKQAAMKLGRLYSISGRVQKGQALGRTFGVPTANMTVRQKPLPLAGVFCVQVTRACGAQHLGVANLGKRPTVDGMKTILEVHVLDFSGSLYGEVLNVSFLHHLREEKKFSSFDALIAQIKTDILEARALMPQLVQDFQIEYDHAPG